MELLQRYIFQTISLSGLAAIFYLCKIYRVGFFRNDINFADFGFPVLADYQMAIFF
ncbi:MAG TPA: hypothetical protein VFH37_00445 [Candidatus Saccharimonadales bacterium]|nr:hypothetical protein [Candidatus Saccharimonadales bacterium]